MIYENVFAVQIVPLTATAVSSKWRFRFYVYGYNQFFSQFISTIYITIQLTQVHLHP